MVRSSSSELAELILLVLGLIKLGGAGIIVVIRSDKSFLNVLIQNKS